MLEMRGVTTRYGNIEVLRNLSLSLVPGQIACLLGSNGAGKSTLIKTILGLVRPVEGAITFEEVRIDGLRPHQIVRRGIAVVPEGRRLFPKMAVLENLRMGAFGETDEQVIAERMEEVFGRFPRLRERSRQLAGTMSGGEQAMLAMGRGLMSRPKLLLLDEPSLGLSPLLVAQLFAMVKQINADGTTIFLVEQNARMTLEVASSGYILQKGEIILAGSAAELRESPIIKRAYLMGERGDT
ncbi:MAG: ABC transporter ATP-binding protein [Candidatus Methylomirabilales bacterium]